MEPASDAVIRAAERKVDAWKEQLFDMSHANRLLFFKPTKASTLDIIHPSLAGIFSSLVIGGKTLTFPLLAELDLLSDTGANDEIPRSERVYRPNEIGTRQPDQQLGRILYNLHSRARTAREEHGVNILYLAFGLLSWTESGQSDFVRSPLILVPVNLFREAPHKPYRLNLVEEDVVLNSTLQLKLRQDFRLELPILPEEMDVPALEQYFQQIDSIVGAHSGWKVVPDVILGVFSFQSQGMVSDLEQHHETLIKHPVVQRLIGLKANPNEGVSSLVAAKDLDDRIRPISVFQVLDADSSQQEAIAAAKQGLSFILQGPPGTGKSQTIANVIAEFLAEGKRVLFVSEKMAALEVVYRRLCQVGLGQYCLEVHSQRRDKREVIKELGASLKAPIVSAPPRFEEKLSDLYETRRKLNSYVRALHQPRFRLGMSAFQSYSELARLARIPLLNFRLDGDPGQVTPEIHRSRLTVISDLANVSQRLGDLELHPWYGCQIVDLTLQIQDDIRTTLDTLADKLQRFAAETARLAALYFVQAPQNVGESRGLLWLAQRYKPDILELPISDIRERYEEYSHVNSLMLNLRSQYREDSVLLRNLSIAKLPSDPKKIVEDLQSVEWLQQRLPRLETAQTATISRKRIENQIRLVIDLTKEIMAGIRFITAQFDPDHQPKFLAHYSQIPFERVIAWCQQQAGYVNRLEDWSRLNSLINKSQNLGLKHFVDTALSQKVPPHYWKHVFERRFFAGYLDAIVQSDPILSDFHAVTHEQLIEYFRRLDREQLRLMRRRIQSQLSQARPQLNLTSAASSEVTILQRELNKQRRLKPLRRLFADIPELILTLRPCLMMSPLTVSQLLDPQRFQFDLVIFDEASQVPSEHAIGAIIRGKQLIVAGDKQQLPPTRFFETLEAFDDNEGDDQPDTFESILSECDAAGLPSQRLLWHYRSRDESLIAFSNYHFYDNQLITFPSPHKAQSEAGHKFIEFVHVPGGVYQRGAERRNIVEARRVVELVLDHFRNHPNWSLGVVTFSQTQQRVIELLLERALKDDPAMGSFFAGTDHEPFFVKSLEQVQGDERDVMFFSVGYGRDETGRFIQNFGPLNKQGGDRRLNVAVTRARWQVKMITSIMPEDIDLARTDSRGVQLLNKYMIMARDGMQAYYASASVDFDADFDSPFERAVYEALTEKGLRLDKQVGVSGYRIDLAVVDPEQPGRYILGIECDGATYHSTATARDRDRLRQEVLENLGWQIHRIWSRSWITNPKGEIDKVFQAITASREKGNKPIEITKVEEPDPELELEFAETIQIEPQEEATQQEIPSWVQPYMKAQIESRGDSVQSFYEAHQSELVDVLTTLVKAEGPIEVNVAIRRVAQTWGIRRVGQQVQGTVEAAINEAIKRNYFKRRGEFLWPLSMETPPVRQPVSGEVTRSIGEIAIEELAEAARQLTQDALSLTEEDLIRETASLFQLRATATAKERIGEAIQLLIRSSWLEYFEDRIRLAREQ